MPASGCFRTTASWSHLLLPDDYLSFLEKQTGTRSREEGTPSSSLLELQCPTSVSIDRASLGVARQAELWLHVPALAKEGLA